VVHVGADRAEVSDERLRSLYGARMLMSTPFAA
jgi:hypothetical protein